MLQHSRTLLTFFLGLTLLHFTNATPLAQARQAEKRASTTIMLDAGVFTGTTTGTIDKFLGIPFAQPP